MKKIFKGLFVIALSLCFVPAFCAVKNKGYFIFYPVKVNDEIYRIYKVYENGKTDVINNLTFNAKIYASPEGVSYPLASPDNEHLAYTTDDAIRVVDLITGVKKEVVSFKDAKKTFGLINGWSSDGKKLLYDQVENIEVESEEEDTGDGSRDYRYNYYAYDITTGSRERVNLKGDFVSWGLDNDIIFQWPDEISPKLSAVDFTGNTVSLFKYKGWGAREINQIYVNTGAGKAVAMAGSSSGNNIRVILIDLSKKTSSDITGKKEWSRIQWPALSPSGKKISWLDSDRHGKDTGYIHDLFVVDKKTIFRTQDLIDEYEWISDSAIAVITRSDADVNSIDELYVINADTGKIINMTPLK